MASTTPKSNTISGQKQRQRKSSGGQLKATRQDAYSVLKSEISRVARKEVRQDTQDLRRTSAQYRGQIAALRRRMDELERALKRLGKERAKGSPAARQPAEDEVDTPRRFSAQRLAATRTKLGLTAAEFGALIGVTGQSIYKWESGKTRPRPAQLEAIARVRGLGKREAAERLAQIMARR
jgi:DNA-binding transcriptional regulator YiaG